MEVCNVIGDVIGICLESVFPCSCLGALCKGLLGSHKEREGNITLQTTFFNFKSGDHGLPEQM